MIQALGYNPSRRVLAVQFLDSGDIWEYEGVYATEFARLASAYSVGKTFNQIIRPHHPGRRITSRKGQAPSETESLSSSPLH